MAPTPVWDIYAAELASKGFGHAMWFPEPNQHGIPEKGDVGFIYEGRFRRLFNVIKPQDSSYPCPPLEYDSELEETIPGWLQTRVVSSESVACRDVSGKVAVDGTAVGAPAGAGLAVEYKCTRERGAMLLLLNNGDKDAVAPNCTFPRYMKKHFNDWVKIFKQKGFDNKALNLVLVRGTVKTTADWTVAAFQNTDKEKSLELSGTLMTAASLSATLSKESKKRPGVEERSGRLLEQSRSTSPAPSGTTAASHSTEHLAPAGDGTELAHKRSRSVESSACTIGEAKTHTIFLPHYKLKYRLFNLLPRKIEAAAEPHDLQPDRDGDAGLSVVVTDADEDSGDEEFNYTPEPGPVDLLLDYLLENSEAEAAAACEQDVHSLFVETQLFPDNLKLWLASEKPEIVIEDGLAMLSMKVAVPRERRAAIRALMRQAQGVDLAVEEFEMRQMENLETGDDADVAMGEENSDGRGGAGDGDDAEDGGDGGAGRRGHHRTFEVKNLVGEGTCLLGKDEGTPNAEFDWPHLRLAEDENEGSAISSISLGPGGELVVTGSDDGIVRIWNVQTGQLLQKWHAHEDAVWTVAFSPDGTQVASGSADSMIFLWDPRSTAGSDTQPVQLEGHETDVWMLAYRHDGKRLASASVDTTVRIWDPIARTLLHTLAGHQTQPMHLAWTPDGTRVVACADTRGIVWDAETGAQVAVMQGHTGAIWSMAVSHRGDRVVTGAEDHSARIWDLQSGTELVQIHEHTGQVWAVAWSPDDDEVATGSYDSTIVTNDSLSGERRQAFGEPSMIINTVAYSTHGKYIASGGAEGQVRLWNRRDGSMLAEWQGHQDKCNNTTFINNNKDLLTSSDDGSLRVWSVQDVLRII